MRNHLVFNFIVTLFLSILNGYLFQMLNKYFQCVDTTENGMSDLPFFIQIFVILLITPVLETYIFQYIPNIIIKRFKWNNEYLSVIIPSVIFSLFHFYNFIYLLMTFFGGLILNYYYIKTMKDSENYVLLTILLHFSYNLYGYLFVV